MVTAAEPPPIQSPANSAADASPPERRTRGGYTVSAAAIQEAHANTPRPVLDEILYFHRHISGERIAYGAAGQLIGYDKSTVSRLFRNQYAGNLDKVAESIRKFRARLVAASSTDFVETSLVKRIRQIVGLARSMNSMAMICSDSQAGKTTALRQIAMEDPKTLYIRLAAQPSVLLLIQDLAAALSIPARSSVPRNRARIMKLIDAQTTLIIDEVHQAFLHRASAVRGLFEVIREIHDRTGCAVILCATDILAEELKGEHAKMLAQTKRRSLGGDIIHLPPLPSAEDIAAFCGNVGLPEPTGKAQDFTRDLLAKDGLEVWLKFLGYGRNLARKKGEDFEWRHVLSAYTAFRNIANG